MNDARSYTIAVNVSVIDTNSSGEQLLDPPRTEMISLIFVFFLIREFVRLYLRLRNIPYEFNLIPYREASLYNSRDAPALSARVFHVSSVSDNAVDIKIDDDVGVDALRPNQGQW